MAHLSLLLLLVVVCDWRGGRHPGCGGGGAGALIEPDGII